MYGMIYICIMHMLSLNFFLLYMPVYFVLFLYLCQSIIVLFQYSDIQLLINIHKFQNSEKGKKRSKNYFYKFLALK